MNTLEQKTLEQLRHAESFIRLTIQSAQACLTSLRCCMTELEAEEAKERAVVYYAKSVSDGVPSPSKPYPTPPVETTEDSPA